MVLDSNRLLKRTLQDVTSVKLDDLRYVPEGSSAQGLPKISALVTPAKAQVYCVASGKGGTGKTVVTTNLAVMICGIINSKHIILHPIILISTFGIVGYFHLLSKCVDPAKRYFLNLCFDLEREKPNRK